MLNSMPDRVDRKSFGEEEMKHYREGFDKKHPHGIEARRPILSFVRSVPVAGNPPEVVDIMDSGRTWLETVTTIPILFFVQPGTMMPEEEFYTWAGKRVTEIEVAGAHMVTEDSLMMLERVLQNGFEKK